MHDSEQDRVNGCIDRKGTQKGKENVLLPMLLIRGLHLYLLSQFGKRVKAT